MRHSLPDLVLVFAKDVALFAGVLSGCMVVGAVVTFIVETLRR